MDKDYWALHAVIVKKPYDIEKAKEEVKDILKDDNKKYYRETPKSYRFRNIPKTKFIKKTFRTKKLNPNISLVFGKLKEEHNHLEGAGIADIIFKPIKAVKKFFAPKKGYNNTTTKNLKLYGDLPIQSLQIARTPIMSVIDKALNVVSFGKWNQLKKEYSFDKLFHLALIANVGTKNLVIEKNEVINVNTSYKMSKDTEVMQVDLQGKTFTTNEMLNKTLQRIGEEKFFLYDGFKYNCQVFVRDLLESEGLYSQKEKDFLFQDLEELAKKMPSLSKKIMRLTTDLGASVNKLTGQGELQGGKLPTAEERKKQEEEFWRQNELVRKRLNAKTNYENRGFMEERKKVKDEKKQFWNAFFNVLEQQGFDRNGQESYLDFLKRIEETFGLFPFPKKNEPLQWEWKKTKNIPITLKDLGVTGEILETMGLGDTATSLLDVYNSGVKMSEKPSLSNAVELGKNIGKYTKGAIDTYKSGATGIAKDTAKNLAKKGVEETKKAVGLGMPVKSKFEDFNIAELQQLARKYKEYMTLPNTDRLNKNQILEELKKHLDFVNGEVQLKEHIFEPIKGYGKKSLKKEFLMDNEDHEKKLSNFENENHSIKEIKETLEGLKTITNNGLEHIKKLEQMLEMEGGSRASAFIACIMKGKNKKDEYKKDFKNYNKEGFKEEKLKNTSSNLINNKFENKSYSDFIFYFSLPTTNDLYPNDKMYNLYYEDIDLAKKAVAQAKKEFNKYLKELDENFGLEFDDEEEKNKLIKDWVKDGGTAKLFKKLYNKEPIKNELTAEMKANINANIKKYKEKKKAEKLLEKVKKGEQVEVPQIANKKEYKKNKK